MKLNLPLILATLSICFHSEALAIAPEMLNPQDALKYWTNERLQNAKPLPMPILNADEVKPISMQAFLQQLKGASVSRAATLPSVTIKPNFTPMFQPKPVQDQSFLPQDIGTNNAPFSSSRLVPLEADVVYPYSATGRLFFNKSGSTANFTCSAAVIAPRVVVTAGRCVHAGTKEGYYKNFVFIPAYRDGAAPLQKWSATSVSTTTSWANSNGKVPNDGDYGLLEIADNTIEGKVRTIGSVTGTLGFMTNKLMPNHLHLLGYPCNMDGCSKLHQVISESSQAVAPNNVVYGSDMGPGSTGGPWIQNFGEKASNQIYGLNQEMNKVVGVTSWGYYSAHIFGQVSANFDAKFTALFDTMCKRKAGNC